MHIKKRHYAYSFSFLYIYLSILNLQARNESITQTNSLLKAY
ncbi:hypothetical protein BACCOPRO_03176 [Phocaeicola coprophilus DSM 18228 = JCM 13818]|uniref:Uncharacterized protein n=1 Tax=Phocaeicola coprophilus DSM 18228 = JCM 13818 TaxID=547042 RepID=S0FBJ8_9BACT|nr:hypothetical protein BACCOPRO_03176 [Phocaeicola coprophilus DSM 18228 = JCM 13818]